MQGCPDPERSAQHPGHCNGGHHQQQGGRQALQNQVKHRGIERMRLPQVKRDHALQVQA